MKKFLPTLACALAPNMIVLILARGLQGLGGGGLIPLSQTVISDLVAPKEFTGRLVAVDDVQALGLGQKDPDPAMFKEHVKSRQLGARLAILLEQALQLRGSFSHALVE